MLSRIPFTALGAELRVSTQTGARRGSSPHPLLLLLFLLLPRWCWRTPFWEPHRPARTSHCPAARQNPLHSSKFRRRQPTNCALTKLSTKGNQILSYVRYREPQILWYVFRYATCGGRASLWTLLHESSSTPVESRGLCPSWRLITIIYLFILTALSKSVWSFCCVGFSPPTVFILNWTVSLRPFALNLRCHLASTYRADGFARTVLRYLPASELDRCVAGDTFASR